MFNLIGHIVEKEHLRGLWKGMTPSLTRTVPGVGLYFSSLHWLKGKYVEPGKELEPLQAVVLGVVARSMSGVCMIPITVIKTRYESGVYEYRGITSALRAIYKTEGVKGLCCGLVPTLFRDAPFSGLYLLFYSQTKQALPQGNYCLYGCSAFKNISQLKEVQNPKNDINCPLKNQAMKD
ncbi:Hypothetical predicted protein [Cloeon dipterum]|nr:Hypothetical predicted protein [Cloeon dipterum]